MNSNEVAITVKDISKIYRIGLKEEIYDSLGQSLFEFVKSPIKNFKKYRSLYKFDDVIKDEDKISEDHSRDILWALKDISFKVNQGEVLGIIGGNGAGKSTLLKILSKITIPTSGHAKIKGKVSSLLEVGTGFHPELTGRENVYLNGTISGMRKTEVDKKFDEIVSFSGIEKFIDTPAKRYSSGMLVRLAFSVAAHLEPEILIIDEVLAVGDVAFQQKCLGKMESVVSEGRTILFVSHNMPAVSSLCTRAILIENGTIVFEGKTDDAINRYMNGNSEKIDVVTIAERNDRKGDGKVRVTDFWFENGRGQRTPVLACNETAAINISYQAERSFKKIRFVVSLYDEYNQRVLRFDSNINFVYLEDWPASGTVCCSLKDMISIKPGIYKTHFSVFSENRLSDAIVDAVRLHVVEGDFFGTGKLFNSWPKFLLQNNWSISPI